MGRRPVLAHRAVRVDGLQPIPGERGDIVLAKVECPQRFVDRVAQELFKPIDEVWLHMGQLRFRVVPSQLDSPFVVRGPGLALGPMGMEGCAGPAHISFSATRLADEP